MTNAKHSFHFFKLEDRVLLDAGPMPGAEASAEGGAGDGFEPSPEELERLHQWLGAAAGQAETMPPHLLTAREPETGDDAAGHDQDAAADPQTIQRTEVVYVDAGVDDVQTLLDGLRSDNATEYVVVHLAADRDGIAAITADLQGRSGVDGIHLLSHGDGDSIRLGNRDVSIDNIAGDAGDIARWAASLDVGADLLIYGCDLASTDDGRDLIDFLAATCDCDVAASDDATGHADLGGDWLLE